MWSFKNFHFLLKNDTEVTKIVLNILTSLFSEGNYIKELITQKQDIIKLSQIKKDIVYLMMRNPQAFEQLKDFIEEELKQFNIITLLENTAFDMDQSMNEIFSIEDVNPQNYFLQINLPGVDSQYDNFAEIFWIKQLPFNINIGIIDDSGHTLDHVILNSFLEFHESNRIILYSKVNEDIRFNPEKFSIKLICMLGDIFIDNYSKMVHQASFLTFDIHDFKLMTKFTKASTGEEFYRVEKEGVVINFMKDTKLESEFLIYSILIYTKINPEKYFYSKKKKVTLQNSHQYSY